jgi:uncharacterized protein (TIGR02270 family)
VPWLIDRMQDPNFARTGGESFMMITGTDLAFDDLQQTNSAVQTGSVLEADDPEAVAIEQQDENLPWPDPDRVRPWWHREGGRFVNGRRYLRGDVIDSSCCQRSWDAGSQTQRRAAAYEVAIARPGKPLWSWCGR